MIAYYTLNIMERLEILSIEHDIEDRVVFKVVTFTNDFRKESKTLKSRIRTNAKGEHYFYHNKQRVFLSDCLRCSD